MAGVFPYRGPGNPVPGPLAPLPDYMSEEKLQEKGEESVRERRLGAGVRVRAAGLAPFPVLASVKTLGVSALIGPHLFFTSNQVSKTTYLKKVKASIICRH